MNPLVSVIIPLYNEPLEFAQMAIDSIIHQTYSKLEIILILDNPENRDIKRMMEDYQRCDTRVKVHFNEKNLGLPETLNNGILMSTGEYIARMDGDDISEKSRIEKQVAFLLSNKDIDLVGTNAYAIDEDGKKIGEYIKLEKDYSQKFMLKHASINLIHPTWTGKSEIFKRCMYRNFCHCEDYDFMIRAYVMGYNFHNMNEKLLNVRIQQKSLRSVSRKYAYEQYVNTLILKKQFKDYKRKHLEKFPDLPLFEYDENDREKYQSTVSMLNDLREAYFSNSFFEMTRLAIKIARCDVRPLAFRLKVLLVFKYLKFMERINLI